MLVNRLAEHFAQQPGNLLPLGVGQQRHELLALLFGQNAIVGEVLANRAQQNDLRAVVGDGDRVVRSLVIADKPALLDAPA